MANISVSRISTARLALAGLLGALALTGTALADPAMTYGIGGTPVEATLSSVSFNIGRMPQYDMETGMILTDVPEQLSAGTVYVNRFMDADSARFIQAVATGADFGTVTIDLENGVELVLSGTRLNNYGTYADISGQLESFEIVAELTQVRIGETTIDIVSNN